MSPSLLSLYRGFWIALTWFTTFHIWMNGVCYILVRERVCGGKGKPVDSSVLTSIKYLRNVQFRALQEETHTQRNTAGERNSEHCVLVCAMTRQKGQCCARWGFIIWRAGKSYYINIVFSATVFQTSYRRFSRPKSFPETAKKQGNVQLNVGSLCLCPP